MAKGANKVIETKRKQTTAKKADTKKVSAVTPPVAKDTAPRTVFKWEDVKPGVEWISTTTPKGEVAPARIKISSRNSDGSYSYFCYRNARAVAVVHDLNNAKDACARGPNPKLSDSVLDYVKNHPGEIPPFLLLSEGERRAIRAQYPYAAPSATKVLAVEGRGVRSDAGDDSDPGTRRLRAQLALDSSGAPGRAARAVAANAAKPKKEALAVAQGVLVRLQGTNPKQQGSAAWKRWEALFEACAAKKTAAQYGADGGNLETLANAMAKGYVKVEEK